MRISGSEPARNESKRPAEPISLEHRGPFEYNKRHWLRIIQNTQDPESI